MRPLGMERLVGAVLRQAISDYRESVQWLEYLDYRIDAIEKKGLKRRKKVKRPLNPSRRYLIDEKTYSTKKKLLQRLKELRLSRLGDIESIERWIIAEEYTEFITDGSLSGEDVVAKLRKEFKK